MPDVNIRVTRVACNTSTGTQDITISGFGTPKAALFILSKGSSDGTAADDAWLSMGATDGTRQWTNAAHSQHNVADTDTGIRYMTDQCVSTVTTSNGAVDSEAAFDSWITDGVRINWGNAPSAGHLLTVVLFNGADLNARADAFDLGTSTSPQTYSSMGFEANALIFCGGAQATADSGTGTMYFQVGLVRNDGAGGVTQVHQTVTDRDARTDAVPVQRMMTDRFCSAISVANGSVFAEATISDFTSSGFNWTNSSAFGTVILFLALDLGGLDCAVGQYDPPTSATTSTISASFTPQFTLLGMNGCQAVDTAEQDSDAGPFGISVIDASAQYSTSIAIEDAAATMNTESLADNTAVRLQTHTGGAFYEAALSSFSSGGVNLSYSAADGTTRKWIYLAIETDVADAGNRRRRALLTRAAA